MDKKLMDKCICPMCPSYVNCSEPIAYCYPEIEISKCITQELGCICPGCPVYELEGFKAEYYCTQGSEL